jgi:hypothetical protein
MECAALPYTTGASFTGKGMEVMTPPNNMLSVLGSKKGARQKCHPTIEIYRSDSPYIDGAGFESYSMTCGKCGLTLVGVVDPRDDSLLLSNLSSGEPINPVAQWLRQRSRTWQVVIGPQ